MLFQPCKLFCCSMLSLVVTNFLLHVLVTGTVFVQLYPVEDIIARYTKGSVCGPELLKKLHSGTEWKDVNEFSL